MTPKTDEIQTQDAPAASIHPAESRPRGAGRAKIAALAAAALAVAAGGTWYAYDSRFESTDDAFIDTHVVAVSPNVPGTVVKVYARDNQQVSQGDPLVDIDPRPFQVRLDAARAEAAAAQAEASQAKGDLERAQQLFKQDATSRQNLDHASASAKTAEARLELARRNAARDELDLAYAKITAPAAGRVTRKSVEEGSYVQVGQPLLAVVPLETWVVANFKETQLSGMRPGQEVRLKVDAYPERTFWGKVESIQSGTGSRFSLLPPENATGNYVKVVQRVPVKIVFDPAPGPDVLLAPGMSVEPRVRVK